MALKELSDGGPDGTRLGQSASDLVAFHGASPTDQLAVVSTVSTTITVTNSGVFCFQSSAQPAALIDAVNSILDLLKEKGLMASS